MKSTDKTETVYFSTKGQVVIPRRLRQELQIEEGTKAIVYRQADHLILKPITRSHISRLRGSLKGTRAMKEFMNERKRERKL
jgi:AbrB family looped-hinge helix DNA binding protein